VASLDLAAQQLSVYHHGVEVTTFPYPLTERCPVTSTKPRKNVVRSSPPRAARETMCCRLPASVALGKSASCEKEPSLVGLEGGQPSS
jgi:hypothetical protein